MILQYFNKKENTQKIIAEETYSLILKKSNKFLNENSFVSSKDYNSSFEIVSIYLIFYINLNINYKINNYKKINEYLIMIFISDLDESLRQKGIGDMSIGKYVKKYVKKFYFRLSKFPTQFHEKATIEFIEYLNLFDLINSEDYHNAANKLIKSYLDIKNSYILGK